MTKRFLIIITVMFVLVYNVYSQVEESVIQKDNKTKEKGKFGRNLVFGGDIGLSFGSVTYVNISPVIGYKVTSRFTAGLGPIYIYENYKNYHLESSTYGGKVILSYAIYKGSGKEDMLGIGDIVLHAENELINVQYFLQDQLTLRYYPDYRKWIDNLLIGGGLSQPLGARFSISIFALWEVTPNHYYNNPIFRLGFSF